MRFRTWSVTFSESCEPPVLAITRPLEISGQENEMATSGKPAAIRAYEDADGAQVIDLFIRVNRELAPTDMRERFETYIQTSIDGEMSHLRDVFSRIKRNAFWVVETDGAIIGMFGIESRGDDSTELRRMYLDPRHRGRGIAQRMLRWAETHARELGFARLILSTAEVQKAAIAFYRKSGYTLVRSERADAMSAKTVGGGLTRFHFEKLL
jgi:GNAT superfamily N-acetyltransferase